MHDFCFTLPYGFVLLIGGLIGFLRKGSTSSLLGGAGSGLLLLLAGKLSLGSFHKGQNNWFAFALETVVSLVVTVVMGQRFKTTGKFMPPGLVFCIGGAMTIFYFYRIATGGNPIVKKDKPS
ncbi:hypothetical protein R1flu_020079 [Riccia fluitans]|uniref:Uncharacterized protein n=1 Tax=Riccia fluitans TaxID=41844 RepID=A0ABD1ZMP1_9MARC